MIIEHACIRIILLVHARTMVIMHACIMIIVHACIMTIVHACTMIITSHTKLFLTLNSRASTPHPLRLDRTVFAHAAPRAQSCACTFGIYIYIYIYMYMCTCTCSDTRNTSFQDVQSIHLFPGPMRPCKMYASPMRFVVALRLVS